MSLINDALKRASQAEKNRPDRPPAGPPMQPTRESRGSGFPVGIVICVVVLLLVAGGLIFRYFAPPRQAAGPPPVHVAVETVTPAPPPKIIALPVPPSVAPAKEVPVVANSSVSPAPPVVVPPKEAPVAVAPLAPFPDVKLQGIFYSRTNPKAIIAGQTRAENDVFNDIRVVKIYADKVTLEWQGQSKDLHLGKQP